MPWCPECGAEYREGFAECSKCGVTLQAKQPDRRRPKPKVSGGKATRGPARATGGASTKAFLRLLGWILAILAVLGGGALYIQLGGPKADPAIRFGVVVGAALSGLVTAAVLLGMAEGLDLLEAILWWVREPEKKQDGAA